MRPSERRAKREQKKAATSIVGAAIIAGAAGIGYTMWKGKKKSVIDSLDDVKDNLTE